MISKVPVLFWMLGLSLTSAQDLFQEILCDDEGSCEYLPDPSIFECDSGFCKVPCNDASECNSKLSTSFGLDTGNLVCDVSGYCQCPTECCGNIACSTPEVCSAEGTCICPEGACCDECCEDNDCISDNVCSGDGSCFCPDGATCCDECCLDEDCIAVGDKRGQTGLKCNIESGFCQCPTETECCGQSDCDRIDDLLVCTEGTCKCPDECCYDIDCPDKDVCVSNECTRSDKPCAALQPQTCRDVTCPALRIRFETIAEEIGGILDVKKFEQACRKCCNAVDAEFGLLTLFRERFCARPQCSALIEIIDSSGALEIIDSSGALDSYCDLVEEDVKPNDLCKERCDVVCTDTEFDQCGEPIASSFDEDCARACRPCCKGVLSKQCFKFGDDKVPQCKKFKEAYPDKYSTLCFPSDSVVETENGEFIRMDELKLGDKVSVMYEDGTLGYEEIYHFGHSDKDAFGLSYIKIMVVDGLQDYEITLSETHYINVPATDGSGLHKLIIAEAVRVGDHVSVVNPITKTVSKATVTDMTYVTAMGAFNPYTMRGHIVVDGVVASSHSDWSLVTKHVVPDAIKPHLPAIYHKLLTLHRWGYKIFGAAEWTDINAKLDPKIRLAVGAT